MTAITQRPGLQTLRSALLVVTTILFFTGLSYLPLADASAVMLVGPLFITALSMPLLGEHVGIRRWSGVVIGFVGALVIIRPGFDAMQPAALFPLAAATTYAFYQIATRILSRSDDTMTTLFYTPAVGAVNSKVSLDVPDWPLSVQPEMSSAVHCVSSAPLSS